MEADKIALQGELKIFKNEHENDQVKVSKLERENSELLEKIRQLEHNRQDTASIKIDLSKQFVAKSDAQTQITFINAPISVSVSVSQGMPQPDSHSQQFIDYERIVQSESLQTEPLQNTPFLAVPTVHQPGQSSPSSLSSVSSNPNAFFSPQSTTESTQFDPHQSQQFAETQQRDQNNFS